ARRWKLQSDHRPCVAIDPQPFGCAPRCRCKAPGLSSSRSSITSVGRGINQQATSVATPAPANSAKMNAGTSEGRIPANVSLSDRARVTAGFAKDVEEVNQYAALI